MTREEKINALIQDEVFDGDTWASEKDFLRHVASILRHGFKGYDNMTEEEIDKIYNNIYENEYV